MKRLVLVLLAYLLSLAAHAPARADDAAEARFFDDLGRRAYVRGRYEEALAAFLDAQAAAPSARTLYNVALAAQLAHHDGLAFSSFESYLDAGTDTDTHRVADARARRDQLARGLALVHVASDPPGAEIWVDRRELGSFGRTPLTLVVEPGAHAIELALANHEPAHLEVVAVIAQRVEQSATLTPHVGTLRVESSPREATLHLSRGEETRELAAGASVSLPVGAWTLRAEAEGYVSESIDVAITREHEERRTVTLTAVPAPVGRLLVSTGDVHARLSIDGAPRAETPARLDGIGVGTHRISLDAEGFVPWEGELEVREGHAARLSVTLVRR